MTRPVVWLIGALVALGTATTAQADERLLAAVRQGNQAVVRDLLQRGVNVDTAGTDGSTALILAADRSDEAIVDLLLRAKARVDIANDYGATALSAACAAGHVAILTRLLDARADPNTTLLSGETALMTAINAGHLDAARVLVARGADVNRREGKGGQTALMWAAANAHPEAVALLIERGADVRARSTGGFTALLFAAQKGDVASGRLLLAAGADANEIRPSDRMTPLMVATASGHDPFVALLLSAGATADAADASGFTALHHAASGGRDRSELVKTLLAHGANPNARTTKDTRERFTAGVSLKGATPLFFAASKGRVEMVRALLAGGADLGLTTEGGTAPIHVAPWGGDPYFRDWTEDEKKNLFDVTKQLVERGADVNSAGEHGWTALHGASYKGVDAIVQLLVERGARTEVFDEYGQTPLSIANAVITARSKDAYYQSSRVVRRSTSDLLLTLGAKPLAESGVEIVDLFYKQP